MPFSWYLCFLLNKIIIFIIKVTDWVELLLLNLLRGHVYFNWVGDGWSGAYVASWLGSVRGCSREFGGGMSECGDEVSIDVNAFVEDEQNRFVESHSAASLLVTHEHAAEQIAHAIPPRGLLALLASTCIVVDSIKLSQHWGHDHG